MYSNFDNPGSRAWLPPPVDPQAGKIVLSYQDLRDMGITYSKEHLRRLEADGLFPERFRLSPNHVVWMFNEVMAWIVERAQSRNIGTGNQQSREA